MSMNAHVIRWLECHINDVWAAIPMYATKQQYGGRGDPEAVRAMFDLIDRLTTTYRAETGGTTYE